MSIFGTVVSLPYKAGTIVFIAVLFALMILEGGCFKSSLLFTSFPQIYHESSSLCSSPCSWIVLQSQWAPGFGPQALQGVYDSRLDFIHHLHYLRSLPFWQKWPMVLIAICINNCCKFFIFFFSSLQVSFVRVCAHCVSLHGDKLCARSHPARCVDQWTQQAATAAWQLVQWDLVAGVFGSPATRRNNETIVWFWFGLHPSAWAAWKDWV